MRIRITGTALAFAIAIALFGSLETTRAQESPLIGELPASGVALVLWNGGDVGELTLAADNRGCSLGSLWASDTGSLVGYVAGAPTFVNAGFETLFPGLVIPGPRPLLLVCKAAPSVPEPGDPLRPPGSPTGIEAIDQVVDAVRSFDGDYAALSGLVRYSEVGCTLVLGGGGPPKCWDIPGAEQAEGALVTVFPFSVCQTEWESQSVGPVRVLSMLVEAADAIEVAGAASPIEVYGIYTVAPAAEPSDWPAGEYAIVLATHTDIGLRGTTVRIANGGVVSIEFGCGFTPPADMAAGLSDGLLDDPLDGLELANEGRIAALEALSLHAIEETAPAWRTVIDLVDPISGYRAVLIDDETVLIDPDGGSVSVSDLVPGETVAINGVPLPWSLWKATQVVVGN